MTTTKNLARVLLAWQLVFGANVAVAGDFVSTQSQGAVAAARAAEDDAAADSQGARRKGLRFRLSGGEGQPEAAGAAAGPKVARAERPSEPETQKILGRLPPLEVEAGDRKDFALRERSLPPPQTGKTINVSFPPSPEAGAPPGDARANAGALEVARFAPEGDAPLSAQVSVTFSRPVAPVTSRAELAATDVPVRLTPQPAGRWRWVGTRTLLFEPEVRLPGATRFTASVPAGTRAVGGAPLAADRSWTFQTPAPRVTATHPAGESQPRDALMFVAFDQRIDPAAVLRSLRVVAGGRVVAALRLAAEAEVRADEAVRKLAAEAGENRWLAFRAAEPLASGAKVNVQIGPGTPSAEGPLTTTAAQSFTFKTYGALAVRDFACGYQKRCSPFDSLRVNFTNPLDAAAFDASQVKIEPAIPDADVQLHGQTVVIEGRKRRLTTYRVTLAAGLKDRFGQTLGRDAVAAFDVGTAEAMLLNPTDGILVVQDPHAPPRFRVNSVNHRALKFRLHAVRPEHWGQFARHVRESNSGRDARAAEVPGRFVGEVTTEVKAGDDEPVETGVDLSPALEGGFGHVVVVVEPAVRANARGGRERVVVWVQVTDIGLDAFVDQTRLHGWATSLKDGRPLAGVALDIQPTGATAATGSDGLAAVELRAAAAAAKQGERAGAEVDPRVLVARLGRDVAMLPENFYPWGGGGGWQRREPGETLRWYVFDDRKMYRPGEEVHVKGWIRRVGTGANGDVSAHDGGRVVNYTLSDSRGNEITKGQLAVNALGGFDTSLKLPPAMNLGHAALLLTSVPGGAAAPAGQHYHHFQVQEFRRPEFEVGARVSAGPHKIGGRAEAVVNAGYFAGGGLADALVSWRVTSKPASFTPPNRDDFTFGKWTPWWTSTRDGGGDETHTETFAGRTDAEGKHRLRIDFDSVEPARASSVEAQASVTDVNRQQWTATTQMLVHPSDFYVGLRSPRTFVRGGEPLVVESIVVDLDGRAIPDRAVEVSAVRLDWAYVKGAWQEREADAQTCAVRSRTEAVECRFVPKAGGRYRVTARVRDERERLNESELTLWVAGGRQPPPARGVAAEKAELIPDRREYAAGETAEILVQSPFVPAEGVLTLRRSGVVRAERFRMTEATHTLRVPVEEGYTPNVYVKVDLVGAAARTGADGQVDEKLPKRPAYAAGELNLSVPPLKRKLTVAAVPREGTLEPGAETTVDVEVKDAVGRAVAGGEVAVVVADESVLALTGYKLDDPLAVFYSQREAGVSDHHLRERVQLADTESLTIRTGGGGGGGAVSTRQVADMPVNGRSYLSLARVSAGTFTEQVSVAGAEYDEPPPPPMATAPPPPGGDQPGIRLRQDFNALAVFAAAVPTDASGRARVAVRVPDNLTRYRVMAVAVAGGKQFGAGESAITARSPLMVRPSAPRFLNFGDRVELPVVVQNQTDKPLDVSIAVRAANANLTDGAGRRLTVAANDRVEVRFPVAAESAGVARFQVGAVAGRHADAAEVSLPVWTPATAEAFATYGEIDSGAIIQSVTAPAGVLPQFGGLELTTSSTQLQELTDAYLYLSAYPYECAEQLSSRVLAVAALKDVLAAFDVKDAPTPAEARAAVARDLKRLQGMQNSDGGFGFWRRGERSWPFVTVHVAHALARAKEKDFHVPPEMLEAVKRYLRAVEARTPSSYPAAAKRAIAAYALNVRLRLGERDAVRARRLVADAGLANLPLEAAGWLLPVVSGDAVSAAETEAIRRHLANRVSETAATAHFVTSYGEEGDYLVLHSERRTDAVILESLIADQPRSDLVAKLARGLLAHRKAGRWSSTQENVFVLLALDRYFRTYESAVPNFTARAWLGAAYAGEMKFAGRTTDRQQLNVPMSYLLDAAKREPAQNLAVAKEGAGRLYYRVGMTYAPANLKLDAADYGFTVERSYEAVDAPGDVRRDADGTWRVKSGARVRVRLTMHAPSRRYHVALVDPLPAGLESLNPALAVTGDVPEDERDAMTTPRPARGWWWNPVWFEHQNLRDERTEAFASLLREGVHTYSYVARATTPGAFVVPPTKAEEMYHPETFGRGHTDKLVVED